MAGTNLGTAYVTIMPSTKGISGSISNALGGEATSAGTKSGNLFVTGLKAVLTGAGVAAVGKFFKDAVNAGGALEQSFGGLDTIYGDAAAGMKEMAYQASLAGISANDYAEQAVSFGAALKQAWEGDTTSAAKQANEVILDMADNSAKLGTDLSSIQMAYQSFARGQYQLLDNLKLGYGGTKQEMERLLKDATALTGVEYNINNVSDVYEAIHAVQQELGITGVAAKEGAETYEGSFKAMKAATQNFMANLSLGEDIKEPLKTLGESVYNYLFGNLLPMIGNIVKQIPGLLYDGLMFAFENLPSAVDSLIGWLNNLADGIGENKGVLLEKMKELGHTMIESLKEVDWIGLGSALINLIWAGLKELAPVLWEGIKWVGKQAWAAITEVDWLGAGKYLLSLIWLGLLELGSLIWESLKAIGLLAWDKFKEVDWLQLGKDVILIIWAGLQTIGSWIWEKLKEIGQTAWDKVKEIDWLELGKTVIKTIWNGLVEIGHWIWEKLQTIGDTAVEKVTSIDWLQLGKDIITFIWDGLVELGHTIWEKLKEIGDDAVEEFKNIDWEQLGKDIIGLLWDGISELGHTIWEGLGSIGQKAASWFTGDDGTDDWSGAGQEIIDKISNGMYGSSGQVNEAASYIASIAASAGNVDGYGIGANVVIGIANGMYAYIGYAQQIAFAVASYVTAAFTGIAGFQINSPSRLMRDKVGKPISEGIAVGITEGMGMIDDAITGVTKMTLGDFNDGLDGYTYTAATTEQTASPITINVYPSAGMDERGLADKVQQQLALAQRQRQAAWGTA